MRAFFPITYRSTALSKSLLFFGVDHVKDSSAFAMENQNIVVLHMYLEMCLSPREKDHYIFFPHQQGKRNKMELHEILLKPGTRKCLCFHLSESFTNWQNQQL
jgi:hypothetical protein